MESADLHFFSALTVNNLFSQFFGLLLPSMLKPKIDLNCKNASAYKSWWENGSDRKEVEEWGEKKMVAISIDIVLLKKISFLYFVQS